MRPELVKILLEAADSLPNVTFLYGRQIQTLQQSSTSVTVTILEKTTQITSTSTHDLLIAADGLRSPTRALILPPSANNTCLYPLNAFTAFFTIPAQPQDLPWSTFHGTSGRKAALTKPCTPTVTSAYLTTLQPSPALRSARESRNVDAQKRALADLFHGTGWETDRLVSGMLASENFYFEELTQVKLPKWHEGRCALLGDTAYCPSPLTGQGTNLAILGAYVLAEKIVREKGDPQRTFEAYERELRPYVEKVQPIPLWGYLPWLVNPETRVGVWVNRKLLGWVSWLRLWRWIPDIKNEAYELPDL